VTTADELLAPAQTNLRLYEELRRAGRDPHAIVATRRAYDLALHLFTGQYRASGKPFVAHLVGTASLLARLGTSDAVVHAGILHAAYAQGVFPGWSGWRRAITEGKRAAVRAAVGPEAEARVFRYTEMPWSAAEADRLARDPPALAGLDPLDRDVLLMRLANELEDLVDLGAAYSAKSFAAAAPAAALAGALGESVLAEALGSARRATESAALPAALRTDREGAFSDAVPRRPGLGLLRRVARWLPRRGPRR
jgi:hypothetical protein